MSRIPTIIVAAALTLAFGAGIAFAQQTELFAAEGSINDAIAHLQNSEEGQRFNSPSLDASRVRALAYLLLAKSELDEVLPPDARLKP